MREMKGFITIAFDEIDWEDDTLMTLPTGIKTKILAVDEKEQMLDQIHKFPVGYVEPRHTHDQKDVLYSYTSLVLARLTNTNPHVHLSS